MVELIKQAAVEAVEESKPTSIVFGKVTSIDPLKIAIDQKLILSSAQLILTNNVRDYDVDMTVDHFTENDAFLNTSHTHPFTGTGSVGAGSFTSIHKHELKGKKTYTIHNALKVCDQVIMIQVQGGQMFLVIEKVVVE